MFPRLYSALPRLPHRGYGFIDGMASERDEHAGGERAGAAQRAAAVDHDVVPLFQVLDYVLHEGLEILRLGLLEHAHVLDGKSKYLYASDIVPLQELGDSVAVVLVLFLERSHVGRQVSLPAALYAPCLHTGSEGHTELPRCSHLVVRYEVHLYGIGLRGAHLFVPHRAYFSEAGIRLENPLLLLPTWH